MSDTLVIGGTTFTGVTGVKASDGNSNTLTYIRPTGTKSITANGNNIDVTEFAAVDVAVPAPSPSLQSKSKTYTPTTSQQTETVTADGGYDGLSSVAITVNAMTAGTAGTPTATKGAVSNHSVSVTPSVTNTTGYITGSTKTGTAVTVTASELVSGDKSITANGTNIDVANYATVSVAVPSGSSKNAQAHESTSRATSSSYTSVNSFTCTKAGTYTVYWSCMRSSTGGTNGSQLYINGTAYGTADTANWSNHVQNKTLTGVTIGANQTVAVYARSRGSNYYAYVPLVTIIEE